MTSSICPTMTPIRAPSRVAIIAEIERKSRVSRKIAMITPISSPTGACSCWPASITMPHRDRRLRSDRVGGFLKRRSDWTCHTVKVVSHVDIGDLPSRNRAGLFGDGC